MGVTKGWEDERRPKANWVKVDSGTTKLFVVTSEDIINVDVHYFNGMTYKCVADEKKCKLCADKKPTKNTFMNVFELDSMTNKVWAFRKTVRDQLRKIREINDGTFEGIVLAVSKEGNDVKTTRWTVANRALKKSEAEKIKDLVKPVDLEDLIPMEYEGEVTPSSPAPSNEFDNIEPPSDKSSKLIEEFMNDDSDAAF